MRLLDDRHVYNASCEAGPNDHQEDTPHFRLLREKSRFESVNYQKLKRQSDLIQKFVESVLDFVPCVC